jgi:hypothetical protein
MEPHTTGAMPALASLTTWDLNVARSASQRRPRVEEPTERLVLVHEGGDRSPHAGLEVADGAVADSHAGEYVWGLKTERVYANV